jgi:hypothetical protein
MPGKPLLRRRPVPWVVALAPVRYSRILLPPPYLKS